jgi:membrane protease YdiL (CAAX protease family)
MNTGLRLNRPAGRVKPLMMGGIALAVMGLIVSPAAAGVETLSLAQVVDTGSVSNQRVGDVIETMRQWKVITLSLSMVLVIALLFAGGLLRPGGYAKAGLRDVSTLPAVVWIFAGFVVILAASSAPTLISKVQWVQDQGYGDLELNTINQVGSYIFAIIAGLGMLFILKRSTMSDGECKSGLGLSLLDLPVGLGCFFLAYPFIELMNMLGVFLYEQTQGMAPDGMAHPTLKLLEDQPQNPWVWALLGAAVIGAPFMEELVYRVFLQGALLKWLKSPWLAIIITALLFAGMHRLGQPPVPWHALVPIFAVGLSCGVAYERTRRVGVPIMIHMCFNLLNVILALMISADASQTGV